MASSELITCHITKRFHIFSIITLFEAGIKVLSTADTDLKANLTLAFTSAWKDNIIQQVYPNQELYCPSEPARPISRYYPYKEPEKTSENDDFVWNNYELNQKAKSLMKKNAMEFTIHGIANAESYAIDLFWDLITRFHRTTRELPMEFFHDMVLIIEQEALHYYSWRYRLDDFNLPYGCFPFPEGLWQSARDTSGKSVPQMTLCFDHLTYFLDDPYR